MSKYHDEVPYVVDVYPLCDILSANVRHDRHYGWSNRWPRDFTNQRRFPETTTLTVTQLDLRGWSVPALDSTRFCAQRVSTQRNGHGTPQIAFNRHDERVAQFH